MNERYWVTVVLLAGASALVVGLMLSGLAIARMTFF